MDSDNLLTEGTSSPLSEIKQCGGSPLNAAQEGECVKPGGGLRAYQMEQQLNDDMMIKYNSIYREKV